LIHGFRLSIFFTLIVTGAASLIGAYRWGGAGFLWRLDRLIFQRR